MTFHRALLCFIYISKTEKRRRLCPEKTERKRKGEKRGRVKKWMVDPPKIMPFEGKPFTADELQKLLGETKDDRMGLVILVTAMYGLRRSEVLGLRWRAIDFENNLLTINHTLTKVNVKDTTELHASDSTKNKSSRRTLPLSESVKVRLLALKAQQEENRKLCGNAYNKDWLDYVFVNEIGDIIRPSYIESVFPRILKKCGLERRRFHDLRHPYVKPTTKMLFKTKSYD